MNADATGRLAELLPSDCPGREELLGLVRIGVKFRRQQCGRRRGFLHHYLLGLCECMERLTFDDVLVELAYQGRRREAFGEAASPIEKIDREFEILTWHHPKRGRQQTPFATLRNKLTEVKKILRR